MKRLFLSLLLIVPIFSLPISSFAALPIPVGGKVVLTKPCDEGLLLTVKTPRGITVPYMWFWGNLPYLSRNAPHVGQNILGMTRTAVIPCTVSGVPYSGGLPIIYHGSSK